MKKRQLNEWNVALHSRMQSAGGGGADNIMLFIALLYFVVNKYIVYIVHLIDWLFIYKLNRVASKIYAVK